MYAALRTGNAVLTMKNLASPDITRVRGLENIKEAALRVGNLAEVRVTLAHNLGNARNLCQRLGPNFLA
jgi:hypothetical protein